MSQTPCVEIDGFKYFTDEADSLGLVSNKIFEPETLSVLKKLTKPGFRVLDIGANIGFFTIQLSKMIGPEGFLIAIEPQKDNFQLLEKNVIANNLNNVRLCNVAVGKAEGIASLYLSDWNGGMHRLYESVCCTDELESVKLTTVDALVSNDRIDLIKIDIEGYEFFALEGAKKCLQQNKNIKIVAEYCALTSIEAGASPLAMLEYMESLGFSAYTLDGNLVDLENLKAEAIKYEEYGYRSLVSECSGKTNPEILEIAVSVAARLGCKRPVLENLLFSR
jgi:FkbM family methyltransferase